MTAKAFLTMSTEDLRNVAALVNSELERRESLDEEEQLRNRWRCIRELERCGVARILQKTCFKASVDVCVTAFSVARRLHYTDAVARVHSSPEVKSWWERTKNQYEEAKAIIASYGIEFAPSLLDGSELATLNDLENPED